MLCSSLTVMRTYCMYMNSAKNLTNEKLIFSARDLLQWGLRSSRKRGTFDRSLTNSQRAFITILTSETSSIHFPNIFIMFIHNVYECTSFVKELHCAYFYTIVIHIVHIVLNARLFLLLYVTFIHTNIVFLKYKGSLASSYTIYCYVHFHCINNMVLYKWYCV